MKENAKRQVVKPQESDYYCPDCGKPLRNVDATESHKNGVYEVHLKASH